jgi:hypothetical protein
MSRIIFQLTNSLGPDGTPYLSISLEEPKVFNSQDRPFACVGTDAEFAALNAAVLNADTVSRAGARLFSAVAEHPDIAAYLQTALQTKAGGRYPVYVEIATSAGAEGLPWEVLCSPGGDFLGLDERWALARMVEPPQTAAPFYTLTPPIRIAAVLSCLGVSAVGELAALRESIASVGQGQTQLLVIASEEQLIIDLQTEQQAGQAPEVFGVEVMPTDLSELQRLVSNFGPHMLHLFCHGSVEGGPHVRLALKSDWQAANPTPGLLAEARDFHGFTRRTEDLPWLAVLNCCEGAAPGPAADAQSLTLGLALEGIAPAVIGLREPVVSDTANLLTRALYTKLLGDLVARIDNAGQPPQPLDWAHLVASARERLARINGQILSQAAASTKEWTMPVVYVRPDEFNIQVAMPPQPVAPEPGQLPPAPDLGGYRPQDESETAARAARLEIEALQALLDTLPPDQAPELRVEASARIAQLATQLGAVVPAGAPVPVVY